MLEPRKVGVCSHCSGSVLLRLDERGRREASCPCGATVIRAGFLRLTKSNASSVAMLRFGARILSGGWRA